MTVAPLRRALLDAARRDAEQAVAEATERATAQVADARARARRLESEAKAEGEALARREMDRRRARAQREARREVLRAQRQCLDDLRHAALATLRERGEQDPEVVALLERTTAVARSQLGGDPEFEQAREGGFLARSGSHRVDYRFSALVDRAIDDLGAEVEWLWR